MARNVSSRFLRPFFVKGAANVFLYQFQLFKKTINRRSGLRLRLMSQFQLSCQRLMEEWMNVPVAPNTGLEVRVSIFGLPGYLKKYNKQSRPKKHFNEVNHGLKEYCVRDSMPMISFREQIALLFVVLSDLGNTGSTTGLASFMAKNRKPQDCITHELKTISICAESTICLFLRELWKKCFLILDTSTLESIRSYGYSTGARIQKVEPRNCCMSSRNASADLRQKLRAKGQKEKGQRTCRPTLLKKEERRGPRLQREHGKV